ncbi:MAG: MFS transporter [Gammaproteobacteria bacterium]|nr:MFS transporter [Gammaproteobacteria bacterium]
MTEGSQATRLLGYIRLQPGLSVMNGYTMVWACLTGIPFLVVINFIQPFILTAILDVPTQEQGSVSGYLAILHEIILIVLTGPFGALSDRVGRRRILAIGFVIAGTGLMVYPWAESITGLILVRCFYAVGAAAIVSAVSVIMADYPQEKSRGKLVALSGVLNGVGILALTTASGTLPKILVSAGYEQVLAGRMAMAIIGCVALASALTVYLGFKGGDLGVDGHGKQPFLKLLWQGFGAARNPRIAVSFASAFAARGDVVVIGTYVSLWGTQAGIAQGMNEADALMGATVLFATIQSSVLVAAPIIGIMNDRINRVTALVFGMGLAAIGYIAFGLQENPLGAGGIAIALLLGVGQISAILAGTTLIGQEADPKITGATIGVWSFCGAVGVMFGSLAGGLLFDWWMPGAPFILMGAMNGLVAIAAIWCRLRYPSNTPLRVAEPRSTA